MQKCWPDVHTNAVEAAFQRLEDAGVVRRDKATILGTPECTIWRVNLDSELRALLYRIRAAAPDQSTLTDQEVATLDAYLSIRARLSGLAYGDELDGETRWRGHLWSVLEYNRKLRDARSGQTEALGAESTVASVAAYVRTLADWYDAAKPEPRPVARAGQTLARAIELGAFADSRFTDLHFALQNCREGRTPLESWRVYFGTAMKWFVEHHDTLTDPPAFHEGPERNETGLGYNGEWARASLSAVATLLEQEATKSKGELVNVEPKGWLKLVEAERVTSINRGTIARAADSGDIADNKKKGRERRVRTDPFTEWALRRAEKGETEESAEAVKRKMQDAGL